MQSSAVASSGNELLLLNHQIRETEHQLAIARARRNRANLYLILGPVLAVALYTLPWVSIVPSTTIQAVYWPTIPLALAFSAAAYYLKRHPGYPKSRSVSNREFISESDLELTLARLKDERKLLVARIDMPFKVRRVAYKEEAYAEIDRLRDESGRYRRVSNILQAILIVGSLAATGVSGVVGQFPELRWATLALTFIVGISSGFTGYFKYKERSFYLQQTADAIENEWEAVEIGVGRYKRYGEEEALAEFVEEVHRLKSEQKKRQQNLEQPPDTRTPSE